MTAHHEELDGCDHGATGKECREDPSTNGKDCEVHGQHGGINEDHCLSTTTTTTAPHSTTSTTSPVVSTSTTSTTAPPVTTTTLSPVLVTVTSNPTPSPAVSAPLDSVTVSTAPAHTPIPLSELPHTGAGVDALAAVGLLLSATGVILRRKFRRA